MQNKILFLVICSTFVIVVIIVGFVYYHNDKKILVKEKQLEINSKVYLQGVISENVIDNFLLDTTKLGNIEVSFKYIKNQKELEGILKLEIVDTEKPSIEAPANFSTTVGVDIDLLKDVKVEDNSKETVGVKIVGEYDFEKAGTYKLKYVATDSSNNTSEKEFTLVVKEKMVTKYDYAKLPEPTGEKIEIGKTSKEYSIYKIDGSIYIEGILIVNKTYPLKDGFVPSDTYTSAVGVTKECNTCINKVAYQAFQEMQADALSLGLNIKITSGYRPLNIQKIIYNNYVNKDGKLKADTYSARPGYSEHQTGLTFDLNSITDAFAFTKEGIWIDENCYKYGFIIRYPKGKDAITGFKYEPWHLRFVGTDLSYPLYNDGDWITLEEYFGITSAYQD